MKVCISEDRKNEKLNEEGGQINWMKGQNNCKGMKSKEHITSQNWKKI